MTATPTHADLAEVVRARARAEWVEWSMVAALADGEEAAVAAGDSHPLLRRAELSLIPGEIGRVVLWSEGQVCHRVAQARRVRDQAPSVWASFRDGRIDGAKAREISSAIDRLERPESIARLDRDVIGYAESHVLAELRRWLKLFVARVEADLFTERAERARADRGVFIEHGEDAMGTLTLTHTSLALAAIGKRLLKEAAAFGKDDERTQMQRQADLLAAWATTTDTGEPAAHTDVAVTMPAESLAGEDQPAVSSDGSWVVPAAWVRELAACESNKIFWHRMLFDPVTDNVLAHDYVGRFAPSILAKALEFRDMTCQVPGCSRPAWTCDIDHRVPFDDGGPTTGSNLGPYCRAHHIQKGFGLIDTGPTATSPPGHSRNTPLHTVGAPFRVATVRTIAIDLFYDPHAA